MNFTITTMIYNDYELLRQWFESIIHNVDPKSYTKILILDDYGNPKGKCREYEEFLEKTYSNVVVLKFNEYRRICYYTDTIYNEKKVFPERFDYREFDTDKPNMGIGTGLEYLVKHIDTEFMYYVDADTIFTSKARNMFNDMSTLFNNHPNCMAIAQVRGIENEEIREFYKLFDYYDPRSHALDHNGGFLGTVSAAIRMEAITKYKIPIDPGRKLSSTWGSFGRQLDVMYPELSTISYPIFTNLMQIHLGSAIIRRLTVDREIGFLFCKDIDINRGTLGPFVIEGGKRRLMYRHYGRGFINMTNKDYLEYLKNKYSKPFDQIQPPLDESLIYTED